MNKFTPGDRVVFSCDAETYAANQEILDLLGGHVFLIQAVYEHNDGSWYGLCPEEDGTPPGLNFPSYRFSERVLQFADQSPSVDISPAELESFLFG